MTGRFQIILTTHLRNRNVINFVVPLIIKLLSGEVFHTDATLSPESLLVLPRFHVTSRTTKFFSGVDTGKQSKSKSSTNML